MKPARGDATERDAVDAIKAQWAQVRPDLDTVPMGVLGRVFRISDAVGLQIERAYAAFGISRGEFDVLATLRRSGVPYTLSPKQLSSTLMITTGGMTGRLDRLERVGLLRRSPEPDDRRGLRITLTAEGLKVVDEAVEAGLAVQSAALGEALSPTEIDKLDQLLRKLSARHG
ncbi:MAG: sle [Ilumatobacteraceae bacterium]|nr:sle [Ilumatobacteraceae bacterium]